MVVVEALRIRRTGWVVVGVVMALVAVSALAWSSGSWRASASDAAESTLVPVTPTRMLDTRVGLGLEGSFASGSPRELRVTGEVATADGVATVVPEGATGVVLNVTVVQPTAPGFVSVRPAGTPGPPTTSNLNFEAGVITPNAVSVQLPTSGEQAGRIEITFDAFGAVGPTADMLIDVVAYTSSTGLADLAARVSALEGQVGSLQSDLSSANATIGSLEAEVAGKQDACADGSVLAYVFVDMSELSDEWTELDGWSCTGVALEAERTSAGFFFLRMDGFDLNSPMASIQLTGYDNVPSNPLSAMLVELSPDSDMAFVHLRRLNGGSAADARVHITVLAAPPS